MARDAPAGDHPGFVWDVVERPPQAPESGDNWSPHSPGDLPATSRRVHMRRATNASRLGQAGRTGRSSCEEHSTVVYVRRFDEGSRQRRARAAR
jgi:hypothetical protein